MVLTRNDVTAFSLLKQEHVMDSSLTESKKMHDDHKSYVKEAAFLRGDSCGLDPHG